MQASPPQGFLNLHKPAGWTSHDCIGKLRRVLKTRQVGHGGTLDPDATGVLPIAVGRATRFLQFLPGNKTYKATFRFGKTSTTDDASGEIKTGIPCPSLTMEAINGILSQFTGTVMQIPPVYSAIRKDGKRLYELAREGATIESLGLEPRPIEIYSIECTELRSKDYPEADFEIRCGSGTYIRAIARDMGKALGCGALMSALHRSQSGAFSDRESVSLELVMRSENPIEFLQPIPSAFRHLPAIPLEDEDVARRWCCGQLFPHPKPELTDIVRVVGLAAESGEAEFLGLAKLHDGWLKALRVLASQG